MDKTPIPTIRHSKDLIEAIKRAQESRSGAQEVREEGKWYVKDGEAILGGPSDSQWVAWMEAAYGPSGSK
jgi:hypothetical protein